MSDFRTVFPAFESTTKISHSDRLLCMGSCFAEHIGSRLARLKFPQLTNPSGIIFNPISMAHSLENLLEDALFSETQLFENQGLWHSFEHHGCFSQTERATTLAGIRAAAEASRLFMKTATRLILTLGTANIFIFRKDGMVVANCHKVPPTAFSRRRLSVAEISEALCTVFEKIKAARPGLEIILTVSPVRHLRDGLVENQRSKATLLLAAEQICQCLPFVQYFPAYEILLDDLRDYRFYDTSLSHPSEQAVDYIWAYFEQAFFEEKTQMLTQRIGQVQQALAHRPFHPHSADHQAFIKNQLEKIRQLQTEFPQLNWETETALLKKYTTAPDG